MAVRRFALFILLPLLLSTALLDEVENEENVIADLKASRNSDMVATKDPSEKSKSSSGGAGSDDQNEKESLDKVLLPALEALFNESLETEDSSSDGPANREEVGQASDTSQVQMSTHKSDAASASTSPKSVDATKLDKAGDEVEAANAPNPHDDEVENFTLDELEQSDGQKKLLGVLKKLTNNMIESIRALFTNQEGEEPEHSVSNENGDEQQLLNFPSSERLEEN